MADDKLPMDGLEAPVDAPQTDQGGAPPADDQPQERARDESGRFAPRQEPGPRGQPDREAARRREAAERDEARREAAEWKAKAEAGQKRFDDMAALARGEAEEQKPDPLADISARLDRITGSMDQQQQQREAEAAWADVSQYANNDEARFTAQTPDFPQATQHYIHSRLLEMKAIGLTEDQAADALTREAQELLISCRQQGTSPSEIIYQMSKARGYSAGQPQMRASTPQPQPSGRPAGGRSFGTGGGPAGGGLTAAQIGAMDDADYAAFRSTPEGRRAIQNAMRNSA